VAFQLLMLCFSLAIHVFACRPRFSVAARLNETVTAISQTSSEAAAGGGVASALLLTGAAASAVLGTASTGGGVSKKLVPSSAGS